MTNQEFSDSFSTLLNSYNTQALFGEEASKREIVLDEYEKSVLLTQAQDIVIKTYFDRTLNNQGQGFDDTTRRQVDFSSLIKVETLSPLNPQPQKAFDHRGIIYKLPTVLAKDGNEYSRVLFILNETLQQATSTSRALVKAGASSTNPNKIQINIGGTLLNIDNSNSHDELKLIVKGVTDPRITAVTIPPTLDSPAILELEIGNNLTDRLIQDKINEILGNADYIDATVEVTGDHTVIDHNSTSTTVLSGATSESNEDPQVEIPAGRRNTKRYVIVPINYKEYDREMSKPYAQPLKKQAWRLIQNVSSGYDIYSELIPIWDVDASTLNYKIRYVERPTPIILVNLPNDLYIDGYNDEMSCILNPILHPDILNKAVELAITTRGQGLVPNGTADLTKAVQSRPSREG